MKIIVIGGTGLIGTKVVKNPRLGPTRFAGLTQPQCLTKPNKTVQPTRFRRVADLGR